MKTGKLGLIGFFAFLAVVLVTIAYVLSGIESVTSLSISINGSSLSSLFEWIATILFTIVGIWASYDFAKRQKKGWRIFWWVIAILAILSVLGIGGANFFA